MNQASKIEIPVEAATAAALSDVRRRELSASSLTGWSGPAPMIPWARSSSGRPPRHGKPV